MKCVVCHHATIWPLQNPCSKGSPEPSQLKAVDVLSCDKSYHINSDMKTGIKQGDTEMNILNKISNYNIYPFFNLRVLYLNIRNLQMKEKEYQRNKYSS